LRQPAPRSDLRAGRTLSLRFRPPFEALRGASQRLPHIDDSHHRRLDRDVLPAGCTGFSATRWRSTKAKGSGAFRSAGPIFAPTVLAHLGPPRDGMDGKLLRCERAEKSRSGRFDWEKWEIVPREGRP
jgi:hypothetical protein